MWLMILLFFFNLIPFFHFYHTCGFFLLCHLYYLYCCEFLCFVTFVGMVRAIDVQNKKIYITTPLSLVDLVRVNTIIRGSSNIPQQIFTEQITKVHNSVMNKQL